MGTLEFKRIMRDVKEQEFDCGVESINNMIKESYYPFITQHAYTYSIYYEKYLIGYIQILLRDIMLYSFAKARICCIIILSAVVPNFFPCHF